MVSRRGLHGPIRFSPCARATALLVLLGLAAGPSCKRRAAGSVAATAGSAAVAQDGIASGTGYRMRVHGVRRCAADALHPTPEGEHWVGVEIELDATGPGHVPANPFYARLVDESGRQYRSSPGPCVPELRHAPLGAGETARGWASFVVSDRAANLELRYAPRLPDAAGEELTFKLGS